jgi:hypothetical protein
MVNGFISNYFKSRFEIIHCDVAVVVPGAYVCSYSTSATSISTLSSSAGMGEPCCSAES